jgi:hypothetical protein
MALHAAFQIFAVAFAAVVGLEGYCRIHGGALGGADRALDRRAARQQAALMTIASRLGWSDGSSVSLTTAGWLRRYAITACTSSSSGYGRATWT